MNEWLGNTKLFGQDAVQARTPPSVRQLAGSAHALTHTQPALCSTRSRTAGTTRPGSKSIRKKCQNDTYNHAHAVSQSASVGQWYASSAHCRAATVFPLFPPTYVAVIHHHYDHDTVPAPPFSLLNYIIPASAHCLYQNLNFTYVISWCEVGVSPIRQELLSVYIF